MLFADGAAGLALLGLWVFCVLDVITTDPDRCRNLPKLAWLLLVLLVPDLGSIAWLVAGRPRRVGAGGGRPAGRAAIPPEYDRPGRARAANPDDDEAFLRGLRERAEEQRRAGGRPEEPA